MRKKGGNKRGVILFCLSYKGTSSRGLNKERVMGAVKRATILGETRNAPQALTLFGKGLQKSGKKESGQGRAKGQEKGQARVKEKESPPKETWESVAPFRIARRKPLALTGQGAMASVNTALIADTPTTVLKPVIIIKGKMRLFS